MNAYIRLTLFATLLSVGTVAAAQQLELMGPFGKGAEVWIAPESITLLESGVRQIDIVMLPAAPVKVTPDSPAVTGKMQVNCSTRQARLLYLKMTEFAGGDQVVRDLPLNNPWLALDETPEDLKTLNRICDWTGAN